jgi:hypothetical protein
MVKGQNKSIEESRISLQKFELVYRAFTKTVDALKWIVIAYFASKAIHDLAGKFTSANFDLSAVIQKGDEAGSPIYLYFIVLFAFVVAVISIQYGRREAHLRKTTVEKLTKQIQTLELQLDPKRKSSLLTTRGDTAEKDKR